MASAQYHNLITASDGELADALGEADRLATEAGERMAAIERELRRRGVNRAAGANFAVVLGRGGAFLMDMTMIAEALAVVPGFEPGEEARL